MPFRSLLRYVLATLVPRSGQSNTFDLDYDKAIHLDAENLAEIGIKEAYHRLLPQLRQYVEQPAVIEEVYDPDTARYSIVVSGNEFVVFSPELPDSEGQAWGMATYLFFKSINEQLVDEGIQFYALNGGNDLFGIFLTREETKRAKLSMLGSPRDWPYLPTSEHPSYGQFHDCLVIEIPERPSWRTVTAAPKHSIMERLRRGPDGRPTYNRGLPERSRSRPRPRHS